MAKVHLAKLTNTVQNIAVSGMACERDPFKNGATRTPEEFAAVAPEFRCKKCEKIYNDKQLKNIENKIEANQMANTTKKQFARINSSNNYRDLNGQILEVHEIALNRVTCIVTAEHAPEIGEFESGVVHADFLPNEVEIIEENFKTLAPVPADQYDKYRELIQLTEQTGVHRFTFENTTFHGEPEEAVREYVRRNPSDKFFIWLQDNYKIVNPEPGAEQLPVWKWNGGVAAVRFAGIYIGSFYEKNEHGFPAYLNAEFTGNETPLFLGHFKTEERAVSEIVKTYRVAIGETPEAEPTQAEKALEFLKEKERHVSANIEYLTRPLQKDFSNFCDWQEWNGAQVAELSLELKYYRQFVEEAEEPNFEGFLEGTAGMLKDNLLRNNRFVSNPRAAKVAQIVLKTIEHYFKILNK